MAIPVYLFLKDEGVTSLQILRILKDDTNIDCRCTYIMMDEPKPEIKALHSKSTNKKVTLYRWLNHMILK